MTQMTPIWLDNPTFNQGHILNLQSSTASTVAAAYAVAKCTIIGIADYI